MRTKFIFVVIAMLTSVSSANAWTWPWSSGTLLSLEQRTIYTPLLAQECMSGSSIKTIAMQNYCTCVAVKMTFIVTIEELTTNDINKFDFNKIKPVIAACIGELR